VSREAAERSAFCAEVIRQAGEVTALPLLLLMFAVAGFSKQITWDVSTRYSMIAGVCSVLRTFDFYCPRKALFRLRTAERPDSRPKHRSWTVAAPLPKSSLTSPPFIKLLVIPAFCKRGQLAV
jgi:hypothetical protein